MSEQISWCVLVVDNDPEICKQIENALEGKEIISGKERIHIITQDNFTASLKDLEKYKVDLIILDVKDEDKVEFKEGETEEVGVQILNKIHKKRYIPVIFYTRIPTSVQHLATPLIRVVGKGTDHTILLDPIQEILSTPFPAMSRALISHLEKKQADFMREFVSTHWENFGNTQNQFDLVYVVLRRFVLSISNDGIKSLLKELKAPEEMYKDDPTVHPMQYYVYPPIEPTPKTGDIYKRKSGKKDEFLVFLTPSCDLVTGRVKAERVLFAHCVLLEEQKEYIKWVDAYKKCQEVDRYCRPEDIDGYVKTQEKLFSFLKNNRQNAQSDRFFYLPSVIEIPHLFVDFQQIEGFDKKELEKMQRIASLDSPFAETLSSAFVRYYGRIGAPDLNIDGIFCTLKEKCNQ